MSDTPEDEEGQLRRIAGAIMRAFDREHLTTQTALAVTGLIASNLLDRASPQLRTNFLDCLLNPEEWDDERRA